MPSGPALARLMAAQVDSNGAGAVVELGGGTGAITAALLEAGVAADRLVVIERDVELHQLLEKRFPEATVLLADVVRLRSHLRHRGIGTVDTVVSGLPLLSMSERLQRIILNQAFAVMDEDGVFVQFTYGPGSPISRAKLERWNLKARAAGYSWRNVPPATVWRLTKAAQTVQ
jgi:phospholipid N-methyltransferase